MRRYEPASTVEAQTVSQMCTTEGGRWVRYDDAKRLIDEARDRETAERDAYIEACQRIGELQADNAKQRSRLRSVAQMLVDSVGADGPMDAEDAAERVIDEIQRLRAKIDAIREWSHVYGAQLRPESTNSADTYGEGVRACKQAVLRLAEDGR